jgi:hypothetical protein
MKFEWRPSAADTSRHSVRPSILHIAAEWPGALSADSVGEVTGDVSVSVVVIVAVVVVVVVLMDMVEGVATVVVAVVVIVVVVVSMVASIVLSVVLALVYAIGVTMGMVGLDVVLMVVVMVVVAAVIVVVLVLAIKSIGEIVIWALGSHERKRATVTQVPFLVSAGFSSGYSWGAPGACGRSTDEERRRAPDALFRCKPILLFLLCVTLGSDWHSTSISRKGPACVFVLD